MLDGFFTSIACTCTSLQQIGMARNFLSTWICKIKQFLFLDPFYSYLLTPEERKTIWSELESNPGPFASQATALTTRPWLLGQNS